MISLAKREVVQQVTEGIFGTYSATRAAHLDPAEAQKDE
jgi:hypothetical protein